MKKQTLSREESARVTKKIKARRKRFMKKVIKTINDYASIGQRIPEPKGLYWYEAYEVIEQLVIDKEFFEKECKRAWKELHAIRKEGK